MIVDTPWMPRLVPTASLGSAVAASTAEVTAGTDNTKFITPAALEGSNPAFAGGTVPAQVAASANTKSPRGGVAFDGTTNARVYAALTGQNIGTDPFSLAWTMQVPTANPSAAKGIVALSSGDSGGFTTGALDVLLDVSGVIAVLLYDATNASNRNNLIGPNIVSLYGGKTITVQFVRNSAGDPTLYINGVSQSFTTSTSGSGATGGWQAPVTSTYLVLGTRASTAEFTGQIHSASLYNLALSAADVLEIAELGGAVPFRYQWGTQAALYSTDFSASTGWSLGSNNTISGGKLNLHLSGDVASQSAAPLLPGKAYRVRLTIDSLAGTAVRASAGGSYVDVGTSTGAKSVEYVATAAGNFALLSAGGGGAVVDTLSVTRLGAVCHFACDEGIGYQLHDASTNALDAVMTTTGVAHLIPRREGWVRGTLTWSATHEGKSLLGQAALPAGAVLALLTRKASASSSGSGCTIGTTTSATRWQTADTFTTAKEIATLANQMPASTAANDSDIVVDPDTANFTGSITVEAHYRVTEGS